MPIVCPSITSIEATNPPYVVKYMPPYMLCDNYAKPTNPPLSY